MNKHFEQIFLEVLNTHASIKKIAQSYPYSLYDKGAQTSTYVELSELENEHLKNKTIENQGLIKNRGISAARNIKREEKII